MAEYIIWFLLGLAMLAAEMATGTFYLLVFGIALGAGGVAALLNLPLPMQITLCAVVGIIGTIILRRSKITQPESTMEQNLDIGQPVRVMHIREDGTLRVAYRGAEWDAELESSDTPHDQPLFIHAMQGSKLILSHHKPQH
jgi:membrane protein implicated in regulation of membrane protease activity